MADRSNGGGGNTLLALIVGALVIIVIAVFAFGWWPGEAQRTVSVDVPRMTTQAPDTPARTEPQTGQY